LSDGGVERLVCGLFNQLVVCPESGDYLRDAVEPDVCGTFRHVIARN
jgi:hypothetical protein